MAEPRRCAFCDEPIESGRYCDSGCQAGYSLFMPKDDEDDEDEPTIEAGDRLALAFTARETNA